MAAISERLADAGLEDAVLNWARGGPSVATDSQSASAVGTVTTYILVQKQRGKTDPEIVDSLVSQGMRPEVGTIAVETFKKNLALRAGFAPDFAAVREDAQYPAGVSFEGGDGASLDQAIVIRGAPNGLIGVMAEHAYLADKLGRENWDWEWVSQALREHGDEQFDVIRARTRDGAEFTVHFDISEFFGQPLLVEAPPMAQEAGSDGPAPASITQTSTTGNAVQQSDNDYAAAARSMLASGMLQPDVVRALEADGLEHDAAWALVRRSRAAEIASGQVAQQREDNHSLMIWGSVLGISGLLLLISWANGHFALPGLLTIYAAYRVYRALND